MIIGFFYCTVCMILFIPPRDERLKIYCKHTCSLYCCSYVCLSHECIQESITQRGNTWKVNLTMDHWLILNAFSFLYSVKWTVILELVRLSKYEYFISIMPVWTKISVCFVSKLVFLPVPKILPLTLHFPFSSPIKLSRRYCPVFDSHSIQNPHYTNPTYTVVTV